MVFWSIIIFLVITVPFSHAEISVLKEGRQFLSLEYKKSSTRIDSTGISTLVGVPPSDIAEITDVRGFGINNNPISIADWSQFLDFEEEGIVRRQRVRRLTIDRSLLERVARIEIDIYFSSPVMTRVKDPMAEAHYNSILINPKQSSGW